FFASLLPTLVLPLPISPTNKIILFIFIICKFVKKIIVLYNKGYSDNNNNQPLFHIRGKAWLVLWRT
ncbi:MAG: hypothetical protein J6A09_03780, partial [Alphaproteobacteria bacterium]|nr:hypothetical protein [Alphaproteobacteria bacterium]